MISVILPTIRPDRILSVVDSIAASATHVPQIVQLVVVADFPKPLIQPGFPFIWLEQPRQGVVAAVNAACAVATGDYLFLTNDETHLDPQCLHALYRAARAGEGLFGPTHYPPYPFVYYGKPFVPFVFAKAETLQTLGGMLDPVYRGFYADPDLSLRAHAKGLPVQVVPDAIIHHRNETSRPDHVAAVQAYLAADRATFRARWDHLGAFCDP